ncbi:S8 family peptidase [Dissulfuribacter thermophilus]|nr:S8 family serine peptidase [Dissulfuribacter thermophilus]
MSRTYILTIAVCFLGSVLLMDSPTSALSEQSVIVIVRLKKGYIAVKRGQRLVLKKDWPRLKDVHPLWIINGFSATVDKRDIESLSNHPEVASVRIDKKFRLNEAPTDSILRSQWNLSVLNVESLRRMGITGRGVVVCVLDTGVDIDHKYLKGKWRGGANSWFDFFDSTLLPTDSIGHGTQVMGIILGGSEQSINGGLGIAPGAQWIAAKIFDNQGFTLLSIIHRALQWLVDPDGDPETEDSPDIVNMSWGISERPDECIQEFSEDISKLKELGIAVVTPAGNGGPSLFTSESPANYNGVISVGAIEERGELSIFSSRGPSACGLKVYPDLVAPGAGLYTTDITFGGIFDEATTIVTGTSFAAAEVTGLIALMKDAFPEMDLYSIEASLRITAKDLGEKGPDNSYGYGLVDPLGAYTWGLNAPKCLDFDHDGYFAQKDCGPLQDLDDFDPCTKALSNAKSNTVLVDISKRQYHPGERLFVTLNTLPKGFNIFIAILLPDGGLWVLDDLNSGYAIEDARDIQPWKGLCTILDLEIPRWSESGNYTLYSYAVPVGEDLVDPRFSKFLNETTFEIVDMPR